MIEMSNLSKHQKRFLKILHDWKDDHLEMIGGYPALIDGETIPDWIVIASQDDGLKPTMDLIYWNDAIRWWFRAVAYRREEKGREEGDPDWCEALSETYEEDEHR